MKHHVALSIAAGLLALGLMVPAVASTGATARPLRDRPAAKLVSLNSGPIQRVAHPSARPNLLRSQGYLVPDQAAYERAKAAASERSSTSSAGTSRSLGSAVVPQIPLSWQGLTDATVTPPDPTGAIGPTRYIETINDKFAIYGRNGSLIFSNNLWSLGGVSSDVTDPQVIWDPGTRRFYYAMLDAARYLGDGPYNIEALGFSRTSSPSDGSTSSWCKYGLLFDSTANDLPDYPKLGDTANFITIGTNDFTNGGNYFGSYTRWFAKPGAGTSCPNLRYGTKYMALPGGSPAFTPVPVNQIDPSGTGYVLATDNVGGGGSAGRVIQYTVTKNSNGGATFTAPVAVPITTYTGPPPDVVQPGTSDVLDPLDGRLTQAVSSIDPADAGRVTIWTQHTVQNTGNSGLSAVQWLGLTPVTTSAFDQGFEQDGSNFYFNGSIAPDRLKTTTTAKYGDSFVMAFNTSSSASFPDVEVVSKTPQGMSAPLRVHASTASERDFSCSPVCRWGDYSAVTPDPAAPALANHGAAWLTNMFVAGGDGAGDGVDTGTWNAHVAPSIEAQMTGPASIFHATPDFAITWAPVAGAPTDYNWQYRAAPYNGPFGSLTPGGTHFAGTLLDSVSAGVATEGTTYCFSVEPTDGVTGFGYTGQKCGATPLDDRNLTYGLKWTEVTSLGTGWLDDTFIRATVLGSSASLSGIQAKSLDVVVGKCPTCGSIKIYWNGVLKKTVSLAAGSQLRDQLVPVVTFGSVQTGTLKIQVSTRGKPVQIDGVEVSRV
jgi:hypothetical protein